MRCPHCIEGCNRCGNGGHVCDWCRVPTPGGLCDDCAGQLFDELLAEELADRPSHSTTRPTDLGEAADLDCGPTA